jgi:hypothetical protein
VLNQTNEHMTPRAKSSCVPKILKIVWLPHEEDKRTREDSAHCNVERAHCLVSAKIMLKRSAKREPYAATGQGGEDKEQTEGDRLPERSLAGVQIDGNRARADEPRFGVHPLKCGGFPKTDGLAIFGRVTATGCRDLPRKPEEKADPDPFDATEHERVFEHQAAEAKRDDEHHESHSGGDAEKAGKTTAYADDRAGRREYDVAGTGRDRRDDGKQNKGERLLGGQKPSPHAREILPDDE